MATGDAFINMFHLSTYESAWHRVSNDSVPHPRDVPLSDAFAIPIGTSAYVPGPVALSDFTHIPLPLKENTPAYTMSNQPPGSSYPIPADPRNPPMTSASPFPPPLAEKAMTSGDQTRHFLASRIREFHNGDAILDLRGSVKSVSLKTKFNDVKKEDGTPHVLLDMDTLVNTVLTCLFESTKSLQKADMYTKGVGDKLSRVKVLDMSDCLLFDKDIFLLWQLTHALSKCRVMILRGTQFKHTTLEQVRAFLSKLDFVDVCYCDMGGLDIRVRLTEEERAKWVVLQGRWKSGTSGDFEYLTPKVYEKDGTHLGSIEAIYAVYSDFMQSEKGKKL